MHEHKAYPLSPSLKTSTFPNKDTKTLSLICLPPFQVAVTKIHFIFIRSLFLVRNNYAATIAFGFVTPIDSSIWCPTLLSMGFGTMGQQDNFCNLMSAGTEKLTKFIRNRNISGRRFI